MQFPCLKRGGTCEKCQFPTEQEVEKELERLQLADKEVNKTVGVYMLVKIHYAKTKNKSGVIECTCGGQLTYGVASNGHIRGKCAGCGVSFME